jgi:pyruvate carboxylase subunit B
MRTEDMLPICEKIDQVGFFSLETWGGATFDAPMRFLAEDPWDRLRKLKEAMPNTPMQMLERAMNIVAYWNFPDDIVEKFIEFAHKNGVDYFRIFDAVNDLRDMETPIRKTKGVGAHAQGVLCYTISPVHTIEYYVENFKKLERMGCDSLCIKDMAGMISPQRAYDIIYACKEGGIRIPIDLHCHTTSGMSGMSYMRACEAGVDVIDCAISPISGGTGQPPTESVVAALLDTPYDTGYDLGLLMECREYFLGVWDKYKHLHRDKAMKVDPSVTVHQIPGGMLSNLVIQLEEFGAADKYYEVLEETHRIQRDFGWPPLVTPTSQIVGVQAVMNVVFGRYRRIPEESKDYIRGMYGRPPGEISEEIYEMILGKNWKDERIECRPADLLEPRYKKCKEELEDLGLLTKEEDVISYAMYPDQTKKLLSGEAKPEFTSSELPLETTMTGRRFIVSLGEEEYDVAIRRASK